MDRDPEVVAGSTQAVTSPVAALVRDVGRAHGLLEHCDQCVGDVCRRVCGVVEVGRRAALQRPGDIGNIAVGVDIFLVGEVGRVLDGLVGNVEDRYRYSAVLEGGAV